MIACPLVSSLTYSRNCCTNELVPSTYSNLVHTWPLVVICTLLAHELRFKSGKLNAETIPKNQFYKSDLRSRMEPEGPCICSFQRFVEQLDKTLMFVRTSTTFTITALDHLDCLTREAVWTALGKMLLGRRKCACVVVVVC